MAWESEIAALAAKVGAGPTDAEIQRMRRELVAASDALRDATEHRPRLEAEVALPSRATFGFGGRAQEGRGLYIRYDGDLAGVRHPPAAWSSREVIAVHAQVEALIALLMQQV